MRIRLQPSDTHMTAMAATVAATFMIAHQVAGKATRDALFLSNFDIEALPVMLVGASLLSVVAVTGVSRWMTKLGPGKLIPPAFGLSALLLLAEWQLALQSPRVAAVAVYLHLAAFGSILISGFWLLVNERFDPRSARKLIGRIGTGGTVGGLAGGILAVKAADTISVTTMLPSLSLMHVFCAVMLLGLKPGSESKERSQSEESPYRSGLRILTEQPYLRSLATLVLLGTVSAALLDYVFKAYAKASFSTEADSYLRLFAVYYTVVGLVSVVLQSGLSRLSLERLGVARTAGTLPSAIAVGSVGALFMPQLVTTALARGAEAVFRNSLFRSAYEVLYTPVPPAEKRATKSIIDVGFERMGDALGGGVTRLLLLLGSETAHSAMLFLALLLAVIGLYISRRLHQGYISALERSLKHRAVDLDLSTIEDKTTRQTLILTMAALKPGLLAPLADESPLERRIHSPEGRGQPVVPDRWAPTLQRISDLLSGKPKRIRQVLSVDLPLEPAQVPHVINLLAWDEVALDAMQALRRTTSTITGQLVDALLNPEQDFSIRRRIPRVLTTEPTQRAADGLMLGMQDQRFEVRFQCGRALAHIHGKNAEIQFDREKVFAAAMREVAVDRRVWESHRLLDQFEDAERTSFFVDGFLADRASRSLEHVFTILSLALPKEPLRIAYRGLHTQDSGLRGTALEYLEAVLPEPVKRSLWPFLEEEERREPVTKTREEILDELMKSNQSIEISLKELRRKDL